ncbi:MAG: hypothetical protein ACREF9_13350, partial [Opitutaceae bacterium]
CVERYGVPPVAEEASHLPGSISWARCPCHSDPPDFTFNYTPRNDYGSIMFATILLELFFSADGDSSMDESWEQRCA